MQLIKTAGKSGPVSTPGSGWLRDVAIGHRLAGGELLVHEPGKACSWCAEAATGLGSGMSEPLLA